MKLVSAKLSKPGGQAVNQDYIGQLPEGAGFSCWVVADGQGEAGQLAVENILAAFAANPAISRPLLENALDWAHRRLLELQIGTASSLRASVALFCSGGRSALWAHMGNARIYAFRDGELIAQTQDHSVAQTLANAGQVSASEIRSHADRRRLMRSLGQQGTVQPTVLEDKFKLQVGDLFLLCSDGFWEHVTELEMQIEWCKSSSLEDWLERMEIRLLGRAQGAYDNYSAVAALVEA